MSHFTSHSPEETEAIGRQIARTLSPNATICFFGDLAAGKTTLIKGFAAELTGLETQDINSPTFTYLNIYEGKQTLYHFDLYRLKDANDFFKQGFEEYLDLEAPCLIEWAEKIESHLSCPYVKVILSHAGESTRKIEVIT